MRNGLRPLIAQSLTCDRSLIYGDIGFGDDELNWICNSTYRKWLVSSETRQKVLVSLNTKFSIFVYP